MAARLISTGIYNQTKVTALLKRNHLFGINNGRIRNKTLCTFGSYQVFDRFQIKRKPQGL